MTTPEPGPAQSNSPAAKAQPSSSGTHTNVPCPFCAMLCDDLEVSNTGGILKVIKNGCPKAVEGFERKLPQATPLIGGKPASLAEAITAAAGLIAAAKLPLYGGLATDVEGIRAALSLADRSGGVIDHVGSEAAFSNIRVLQSTGWVMSTLTEVRNRADLIIIAGTDVHALHPRFFKRIATPSDTLFGDIKRTIVFIGEGLATAAAKGPGVEKIVTLASPISETGAVIGALRARLRGTPLPENTVAGVSLAAIDEVAELCRKAAYGVVVWSPAAFTFPNPDLTVQVICDMVRELNVSQRFAGLSLGGNEGGTSAGAVSSWQTGYPLRVSFASGIPIHDARRFALPRMLASGEGDLLVWTSTFLPTTAVPSTTIPKIVIGTPGLEGVNGAAVYIPVGTPGIDHEGRLIRTDNVVSLHLHNLHRAPLPSAASVLSEIETALALNPR